MNWFVVWWIITTHVSGGSLPVPDKYTGEYPRVASLVCESETRKSIRCQMFETKEEAEAFKRAAPDDLKPQMTVLPCFKQRTVSILD